ncbi:MAG: hypothetical protein AVDCRST_MAG59-3431, partial [uncultured Thermomicrobiales bacterium]
ESAGGEPRGRARWAALRAQQPSPVRPHLAGCRRRPRVRDGRPRAGPGGHRRRRPHRYRQCLVRPSPSRRPGARLRAQPGDICPARSQHPAERPPPGGGVQRRGCPGARDDPALDAARRQLGRRHRPPLLARGSAGATRGRCGGDALVAAGGAGRPRQVGCRGGRVGGPGRGGASAGPGAAAGAGVPRQLRQSGQPAGRGAGHPPRGRIPDAGRAGRPRRLAPPRPSRRPLLADRPRLAPGAGYRAEGAAPV